ncbi:SDR family NAD(P)-dependent oxidoreductase [Actinoplanes sp. GCM10030250]|uniref:SDR family NAD(P)-dependent oxidoreductase n=1 Tax=Actinoplanes sp. GCM10030250 TaxID=3273376 RepID=UPI003617F303
MIGWAAVVVALHLLGLSAWIGLSAGVAVIAYLVGSRRSFDAANIRGPLFFAGYAAIVFALTSVLATVLQGWVDTTWEGVFLGILGIVSLIVLIGAVAESRKTSTPVSEVRRGPLQLVGAGALAAFGPSLIVEVALLVLAAEAAVPEVAPWYRAVVLSVVFTAGFGLGGLVRKPRPLVCRMAVAAVTALVAVITSMIRLPDVDLGLPGGPPAELANRLVGNLGLILLVIVVAVGVVAFRRSRPERVLAAPAYYSPGRVPQPIADQRQVAIVTGAGAGLGRATALGLAASGYGILAVDSDGGSAEACATQMQAYGVPALALAADVRDPRDLERIVTVSTEWGGPAVLVNCLPGVALEVTAGMLLSHLVLEPMRQRGGGAIVNVAPESSGLITYTGGLAGPATDFGVRAMTVTTDPRTPPSEVVAAVLDLIGQGAPGAVAALTRSVRS